METCEATTSHLYYQEVMYDEFSIFAGKFTAHGECRR